MPGYPEAAVTKVASVVFILNEAEMVATVWGGPTEGVFLGARRMPHATSQAVGKPCLVHSPDATWGLGLGWWRVLWNSSCISAAVRMAWPLPKPLVPFFSCFIGTFPEPNIFN